MSGVSCVMLLVAFFTLFYYDHIRVCWFVLVFCLFGLLFYCFVVVVLFLVFVCLFLVVLFCFELKPIACTKLVHYQI